jgi:hypothetical protein
MARLMQHNTKHNTKKLGVIGEHNLGDNVKAPISQT